MVGTPVAVELERPLLDIVVDSERAYAERSDAAKALHEAQIPIDWQQAIVHLLELDDADSARLACRILTRLDARELPAATLHRHRSFPPGSDRNHSCERLPRSGPHKSETSSRIWMPDTLAELAR